MVFGNGQKEKMTNTKTVDGAEWSMVLTTDLSRDDEVGYSRRWIVDWPDVYIHGN